jgi:hypothetical protein
VEDAKRGSGEIIPRENFLGIDVGGIKPPGGDFCIGERVRRNHLPDGDWCDAIPIVYGSIFAVPSRGDKFLWDSSGDSACPDE